MKNNKGITLVALIITIIVLLILSGITISAIIGENGIIGKAQRAKSRAIEATERAETVTDRKVEIEGAEYDSVDQYNQENSTRKIEKFSEIYTTTQNYTDKNGKIAMIPKGFAVGISDGINTIDDGLVIKDDLGNQYVWIPVHYLNEKYGTTSTPSVFTIVNWKTYNFGENENIPEGPTYSTNGDLNTIKRSVEVCGGFYIGRYEAGCIEPRTLESDESSKLLVQKYLYPYNFTHNTGMDINSLCQQMYNTRDYDVVCALCPGEAWDATMFFIHDSTHDVKNSLSWGNYLQRNFMFSGSYYADTTGQDVDIEWLADTHIKQAGTPALLQTGANETNKAKNIYDLAGNVAERTTENGGTYSTDSTPGGGVYLNIQGGNLAGGRGNNAGGTISINRGGSFLSVDDEENTLCGASSVSEVFPEQSTSLEGFRPILYVSIPEVYEH